MNKMDVEARSRLESVLSVLEHEMEALEALRDVRVSDAVRGRLAALRTEIVAALASLEQPPTNSPT